MANPTNYLRATFFFADNEVSTGWSETLFQQGSNLQNAFQSAYAIAQLRRAFLPVQFQILWIRVDNLFSPRQYISGTAAINGPLPGQYATSQAMSADTRILSQFTGQGPGQINRQFLGGVSAADVKFQQFSPTQAWLDAFTPWANNLTQTAPWNVYNRFISPSAVRVNILDFTVPTGRGNIIECTTTLGMFVGQIVRIVAPQGEVQGLQGYKVVTYVNDATHFTVGGVNAVGSLPDPSNSYFTPVNPQMNLISQVRYERLTNRRSGRPFAQPVGRRQNRIPLRA